MWETQTIVCQQLISGTLRTQGLQHLLLSYLPHLQQFSLFSVKEMHLVVLEYSLAHLGQWVCSSKAVFLSKDYNLSSLDT